MASAGREGLTVAGEANQYAMNATHIPATEEELDRWLLNAQRQNGGMACYVVPRLIAELVMSRSLGRLNRDKIEDAKREARANAVLLQRAEQRIAELQRELDDVTTQRNRLLAGPPKPLPCPHCGMKPLCTKDGECIACRKPVNL